MTVTPIHGKPTKNMTVYLVDVRELCWNNGPLFVSNKSLVRDLQDKHNRKIHCIKFRSKKVC